MKDKLKDYSTCRP